jgi:CRISPR-associated endonuclease/helicase Cas3
LSAEPVDEATRKLVMASESENDERLSEFAWKTIATHGRETGTLARDIGAGLGLPERILYLLHLAGRWHDAGKAHETFQYAILKDARSNGGVLAQRRDLAKAPEHAWKRPAYPDRPGFRHELASTLALFELLRRTVPKHAAMLGPHEELLELLGTPAEMVPLDERLGAHAPAREIAALSASEFNLVAWLVCTHHGKVRCRWTSTPHDQEKGHGGIFGIVDGDVVPGLLLSTESGGVEALPDLPLSLDAAMMGVSRRFGAGWGERVSMLLEEYGPFVLAYLEAILRAADARASQYVTEDPLG